MKNIFLGATAITTLFLSACSYNQVFEPWFDEAQPLYENDIKNTAQKEQAGQSAPITNQNNQQSENIDVKPTPERWQRYNPDDPKNEANFDLKDQDTQDTSKPKKNSTPATNTAAHTYDEHDTEPELEVISNNTALKMESRGTDTDHPVQRRYEPLVSKESPVQTVVTAPSISFVAAYIPYIKDSAKLDRKDTANIKEAIDVCNEYSCIIRIAPHTTSNHKNWQQLSDKRIANIRKYLAKYGIDESRIIVDNNIPDGNFIKIFIEY